MPQASLNQQATPQYNHAQGLRGSQVRHELRSAFVPTWLQLQVQKNHYHKLPLLAPTLIIYTTMEAELDRLRRRSGSLLSCFHDGKAPSSKKDLQPAPAGTISALPRKLYRIQHSKARAMFNSDGDLMASLLSYAPKTVQQWRECLNIHLQWTTAHTESPFMSALNNIWRALEWAEDLARTRVPGESHVILYEINTALLEDTAVFHVNSALQGLAMETPGWMVEYHEYLLLHRVPQGAIKEVMNVSNPLAHGMYLPPSEGTDDRNTDNRAQNSPFPASNTMLATHSAASSRVIVSFA